VFEKFLLSKAAGMSLWIFLNASLQAAKSNRQPGKGAEETADTGIKICISSAKDNLYVFSRLCHNLKKETDTI
jgi:hypothetical protein